ncbi:hypothetical protein [Bradyrhizobium liaoningense]
MAQDDRLWKSSAPAIT